MKKNYSSDLFVLIISFASEKVWKNCSKWLLWTQPLSWNQWKNIWIFLLNCRDYPTSVIWWWTKSGFSLVRLSMGSTNVSYIKFVTSFPKIKSPVVKGLQSMKPNTRPNYLYSNIKKCGILEVFSMDKNY